MWNKNNLSYKIYFFFIINKTLLLIKDWKKYIKKNGKKNNVEGKK